ncbi:MAG TPA: TrkA C-terminal domain-containing protein, partial [Gemmatimonadales bacterium]|nr:TrkA C-terminal domain-containing protein [Gemmatimonadales bacterium]
ARRGTLDAAGAGAARAAVVAVGDPGATRRIVVLLRQLNPALPVIARAHRVEEVTELERLGANEIVPSEFEASIEIFDRLLRRLGVPRHVVRLQEALIRGEHYRALRGLGAEGAVAEEARRHLGAGLLETGMVMAGSPAEGATLGELRLPERHGVRVLAVVRAERALDALEADTRLVAGDLVVLLGPHQGVAKAVTELGRSMPEVAGGL